jgi:small conductance mechanosensitive channel
MQIDFGVVIERLQGMVNGFFTELPNLVVGVILAIGAFYFARLVRRGVTRFSELRHHPENVATVLGRLSQWTTLTLGLLIALLVVFPAFTVAQLIGLLGASGLVAGLAFRSIFEDFFAGVLLLLSEPFVVGDQILVDEHEGTIEEIQARVTFIQTYDNRRVVVPNADLFTHAVVVNTAYQARRLEYDVGIGYGDDVARAAQVIYDALADLSSVLQEPAPEVLLRELAGYYVALRVRWWITPPRRADALDSRDAVLAQIKVRLTEAGIDLPFPTQQVLFHDQTEETDGDRSRQREGWPAGEGEAPAAYRIVDALRARAAADAGERSRT